MNSYVYFHIMNALDITFLESEDKTMLESKCWWQNGGGVHVKYISWCE